jgi:hypothetical protein
MAHTARQRAKHTMAQTARQRGHRPRDRGPSTAATQALIPATGLEAQSPTTHSTCHTPIERRSDAVKMVQSVKMVHSVRQH